MDDPLPQTGSVDDRGLMQLRRNARQYGDEDDEGENISDLLEDGSRYYGRHTKDPLDDIDSGDFL